MDTRIPKRWVPGEVISSARLNEPLDILQSLSHGPRDTPGPVNTIFWVRLKEWIGPEADFVDRSAVIQFYDTSTDKWKDTNPEQEIALATDPLAAMTYPAGLVVPVLAHRSGKYVPLWPGVVTLDGVLDEALSPGSTATMSIHWRTSGGEYEDTGVNVEVCASPLLPDDADDLAAGVFVTATFHPPRGASFPAYWDVVQSECEDTGGGGG